MAESALLKREVATKGRGKADAASKKLRETVLEREQLTATVADLQRALASQQAEGSSFSCEAPPSPDFGVSCSGGSAEAAKKPGMKRAAVKFRLQCTSDRWRE